MQSKTCSKCGGEKRFTASGRWTCDPCSRARATAYRQANIETVRAKDRARAAAQSAEYKRAKHKRWRDANAEHVRAYGREEMKKLYARDPEKFRQRSQEWRKANIEKAMAASRNWRCENEERIRSWRTSYLERNAERVRASTVQWRAKNKDMLREQKSRECRELHDAYIKKVIDPDGVIRKLGIPQPLIEAKRVQLQIKRFLKEQVK